MAARQCVKPPASLSSSAGLMSVMNLCDVSPQSDCLENVWHGLDFQSGAIESLHGAFTNKSLRLLCILRLSPPRQTEMCWMARSDLCQLPVWALLCRVTLSMDNTARWPNTAWNTWATVNSWGNQWWVTLSPAYACAMSAQLEISQWNHQS